MAAGKENGTLDPDDVGQALGFAGLSRSDLKQGADPDGGEKCLCLTADVRQYSAFLVGLASQRGAAAGLAVLADRVQIEHDSNGDTRYWLPGITVAGF